MSTPLLIFERLLILRELHPHQLNKRFRMYLPAMNFVPTQSDSADLLGIESEMALRLLHKTQSAKNLGDLNTLLRDFVLTDQTRRCGGRLVNEFAELNAAHQSVVTAREHSSNARAGAQ